MVRRPEDRPDALERVVESWAADVSTSEAARLRSRTRSLRRQAAEDTDLESALSDLAEAGTPLTVVLVDGSRVAAVIGRVGGGLAEAWPADGGVMVVRIESLVGIEAVPGGRLPWPAGSRRRDASPVDLAVVLADAADSEPNVRLLLRDGRWATGDLLLVAQDFLILRAGRDSYVPLDAVLAARLPASES
ncbi:MAG TPA: hypothetical protein VFA11_01505 [Acidimicrobiales bacterium]|nr:hypothetical protein [Acidimicrobiales bacterium]